MIDLGQLRNPIWKRSDNLRDPAVLPLSVCSAFSELSAASGPTVFQRIGGWQEMGRSSTFPGGCQPPALEQAPAK